MNPRPFQTRTSQHVLKARARRRTRRIPLRTNAPSCRHFNGKSSPHVGHLHDRVALPNAHAAELAGGLGQARRRAARDGGATLTSPTLGLSNTRMPSRLPGSCPQSPPDNQDTRSRTASSKTSDQRPALYPSTSVAIHARITSHESCRAIRSLQYIGPIAVCAASICRHRSSAAGAKAGSLEVGRWRVWCSVSISSASADTLL